MELGPCIKDAALFNSINRLSVGVCVMYSLVPTPLMKTYNLKLKLNLITEKTRLEGIVVILGCLQSPLINHNCTK